MPKKPQQVAFFLVRSMYRIMSVLESVLGSVAGVQMTINASSSLCPSTLTMYPTTGRSAWTCCKDSSRRRLDKSWSVLWQNHLSMQTNVHKNFTQINTLIEKYRWLLMCIRTNVVLSATILIINIYFKQKALMDLEDNLEIIVYLGVESLSEMLFISGESCSH